MTITQKCIERKDSARKHASSETIPEVYQGVGVELWTFLFFLDLIGFWNSKTKVSEKISIVNSTYNRAAILT